MPWPWPRHVKSLALEAWPWPWKSSITTFSFGLSYCLHFSVNELMKVQIVVVGLLFSVYSMQNVLNFHLVTFLLAEEAMVKVPESDAVML